jgi:hypothetical protein
VFNFFLFSLLVFCLDCWLISVGSKVNRNPGDRWMIKGPTDYVPPVTVEVVEKRKCFPLDDNEGIYVRDMQSGKIRMITSMLKISFLVSFMNFLLVFIRYLFY